MSLYTKKLSLLLVEDNSSIQQGVKIMLESMNCDVSIASTVSEAIQKFDPLFDGILTDIGLPDGTGFDVVKNIYQNYPTNEAVIYAYSAFGSEYIRERIGNLPINGYFDKPFLKEDIEKFVQAVIDNKRKTVA